MTFRHIAALKALVWTLPLAGCIDALAPDVGPLTENFCSNDDSLPSVDQSFDADILGDLFVNPPGECLNCHSPNSGTQTGYSIGGLDLSSYSGLTSGGANSSANIVVSGAPCDSVIYKKISEGPPFGARMPQDGPPYLDDDDISVISDWIAEGAHDN